MKQTTKFLLPQALTIYDVSEVHAELLAVISGDGALELDGKNVKEIDGSGLQLLLWVRHECLHRDKPLQLRSSSDELIRCFKLLDISFNERSSQEVQ